jgi:hypothetical protein
MKPEKEFEELLKAMPPWKKRPKKPEPPKSATAKAAERFDPERKPTEALMQDAAAHNRALAARLRAERPGGMSEEEAKACAWQQKYDWAWEQNLAHQAELEELANPDPIEAYSRSLWGRR